MGRVILTFCQDASLRQTLTGLLAAAGLATNGTSDPPAAILVGCRGHIAPNDLAMARAGSRNGARVPIILVTSRGSEDLAITALRAGITNYLRLPLTPEQLAQAIDAAAPDNCGARSADPILGVSEAILEVKKSLWRAASCDTNVLITGETGTGKELAAEIVHRRSNRTAKPMIVINCAAIPDDLLESELFGFERGAFTGAHVSRAGKLKLAAGGTVFLDEIGDLSPFAQAKILRVLETGEIQTLGCERSQKINVRILAATNRDLDHDPRFRRDLYFRLNVARIHMPPLRERKEDIELLAEAFRKEFDLRFGCVTRAFAPGVRELLLAHSWPGNIRELRNIVEAGFIDPGPDANGHIHMPRRFRDALNGALGDELNQILSALSKHSWNRTLAAKELQWSRMTLYRKMSRYKIGHHSS
jgi:DNA-binding NtrC family response regulator